MAMQLFGKKDGCLFRNLTLRAEDGLTPKVPWFGYTLGHWTKRDEEEAQLALKGEYYKTGEQIAKERKKV